MASIVSAGTTSATALNMSADTSGVLQLASNNGTVAVTVDTSQNVGVGTSSPGAKLDVNGTIRSKTSTGGIINMDSTAAGTTNTLGSYANAGAAFADFNLSANNTIFLQAGTERARIDSSGNFGIAVTPSGYYVLEVASAGGTAAKNGSSICTVAMGRSGGDYPWVGYNFRATTTSGSYTYNANDYASALNFYQGGIRTQTAVSGSAGNAITWVSGPSISQGSANWAAGASDVRQKKNFEPSQGLAEVLQIEPVKFHFNWEDDNSPKKLGFKAQNLLPLIPEMVVEKDEKAEDGTPYLTITPDFMLPVLVKAIQEQQALIIQLQADVAALKGAA